ncbi:hypothetical protein PG988_006729 [Apiospora saccharicola]
MDPGTAIGLAGTVYKVVIAGIEFVGDAKQVYAKGGTDDNRDLDAVAQDVQSASASLEEQLDRAKALVEGSGGEDQLNTEDEELRQLAIRASGIGKELSAALGKSQVGEKSKFKAFKAVVRGNWDADDIKKIEARLNAVRNELQLKVLISIKGRLDGPQNESYKPMFTMLESLINHQAQSGEDRKRMMESLSRTEELTSSMRDELLASKQQILTELRSAQPSFLIHHQGSASDEAAIRRAEDAILASLYYPSMADREESINEAHMKTFEWLFQDPTTSDVPFSSLVDFLKSDTAKAYWITGKPGSGKSTAMKFLLGDPRTSGLLEHWSGGKRVLRAPFYFFYNGSDMQKSELGLLSSLLYTLLHEERKLIPIGFKGRFEAALGGGPISAQEPSVFEARRALKEIILHSPDFFFFLTVDGLDEFDPQVSTTDVASLLQLTKSLSAFDNAKLILSSRPLSAFEHGFAGCPSLEIHTLTRNDIQAYVLDRLQSHPRMKMLMSRNEVEARTLVQAIGENSSGVFLWVRLVVESLLEGLENSDGLEELQARLDELPHDLHTLYWVMLSRIPPQYKSQTAKLIHIVEKATKNMYELSLLGLWYADQWSDKDLFDAPTSPFSEDQILAHTEDMKGRLKSRCLGLVEIQSKPITEWSLSWWNEFPRSDVYDPRHDRLKLHVKFIHRTVSDFLAKEEVRRRFIELPSLSAFDPDVTLLRAAIAIIKGFNPSRDTDWVVLMKLAGLFINRFRHFSAEPNYQLKLIKELDGAMSMHMATQLLAPWDSMSPERGFVQGEPCGAHRSSWLDRASWREPADHNNSDSSNDERYLFDKVPWRKRQASFMSFLVISDKESILKHLANAHGQSVMRKEGLSLLGYALCFSWPWHSRGSLVEPSMVNLLLANGDSPHEEYGGRTIWYWYLRTRIGVSSWAHLPKARYLNWVINGREVDTMLALLNVGADVNGRVEWVEPGFFIPRNSRIHRSDEYTKTWCTLLLAARRSLRLTTEYVTMPGLDMAPEIIQKSITTIEKRLVGFIRWLEEHKAVEQEWDEDDNLISPVTAVQDEGSDVAEYPASPTEALQHTLLPTPPQSTTMDTDCGSNSKAQGSGSAKEEKERVVESVSHKSTTQLRDETATVQVLRGRGSRIRSKFNSWVRSITGKPKMTA